MKNSWSFTEKRDLQHSHKQRKRLGTHFKTTVVHRHHLLRGYSEDFDLNKKLYKLYYLKIKSQMLQQCFALKMGGVGEVFLQKAAALTELIQPAAFQLNNWFV